MSKLITVIGFNTDNAILAERLCDWIYQLSGKEQGGHAVLVCDQQVHEELRQKVRIAAEVAFSGVEMVVASVDVIPKQIPSHYWMNLMFIKAADHMQRCYRWPWLWLEPECVPVKDNWMESIMAAYDSQPKRYMGTHMQLGDTRFLNRIAVYPPSAYFDVREVKQTEGPFEIAASQRIIPKSSRTKVFQHLKFQDETDIEKVREDASVVVGDAVGILIESMRELKPVKRESIHITQQLGGQLPKPQKIDGRTKSGKAALAAMKEHP